MADIDHQKHEIRVRVREQRAQRPAAERDVTGAGFTEQLIALCESRGPKTVSCYVSIDGEPDTSGFLSWAAENGIDVLLPVTRADGLMDWVLPSGEGFVPGPYGIPEPLGEVVSPMAVGEAGLMIIPACSIDRTGVRLGWGGGYFDKTLGSMDKRPPVFAVVYADEFVESLPSDVHDIPVTGVVTPQQITYLDLSD